MEFRGITYLKAKLALKQPRVLRRYKFYEMKNHTLDFGISTPPRLRDWNSVLGWCAKAVDSLADRLQFRGFADDYFGLDEIFDLNNRDVMLDSAVLSALISSCCFIYISEDETGYPRLQVIDGANATGILDPITNLLTEGYAVLQRDDRMWYGSMAGMLGEPVLEAYFRPDVTAFYENGKLARTVPNKAPYPLLVPIIFRPDAVREFGHSRISRACMSIVGSAMRTIKRSEISAEFYSFPQKYVTGTNYEADGDGLDEPGSNPIDRWKAAMSALLEFPVGEDGEVAKVGQFTQQSMQPHSDQLRMFASLFAGETGLTLDDLGFATENPSSAEAIKAAHENLRLTARKAQRTFGSGFLNAGYLAACVRDNYKYQRRQIYLTKPKWEPVFEPDAAMLSSIGDGAIKVNQAIPGYFGINTLRDLTGIEAEA